MVRVGVRVKVSVGVKVKVRVSVRISVRVRGRIIFVNRVRPHGQITRKSTHVSLFVLTLG